MTAFAAPGSAPLLIVVVGADSQGRLRVRLSVDAVVRLMSEGLFGASPELTKGLAEAAQSADSSLGGLDALLRAAPGAAPEPDLDAMAASNWLAGDPQRHDARSWLLAGWDGPNGLVRTIWDYVPLDAAPEGAGAATESAALQFILDEHPELPIELADLARAMSALELPEASGPLHELAAVLSDLGVAHERLPDGGPLGFAMGDDQDEWQCLADVVESGWLVLYAELPEAADAAGNALAAAYVKVAGINARLQVGALLLDGDAGALMYRAATDVASPLGRIGALRRLLDLVHADVRSVLAAWRDES